MVKHKSRLKEIRQGTGLTIPSSVLVELANALHTTPNYLLLGDVEADDWMDDMVEMREKRKRGEHRELGKKRRALLAEIGDH